MITGLTDRDVQLYHKAHGYNEITETRESLIRKILKRAISPISVMLLLAALLALVSKKTFDAGFILILFAINVAVTLWQEHKADTAIAALNHHFESRLNVLRDGAWQTIVARMLVPGDVVKLSTGSIVPADASIVESHGITVNEAALTGESLPKEKRDDEMLYSGSFIASGTVVARITAIGDATSFGKTVKKTDAIRKKSALESDILRISRFLSYLSIGAVVILTIVLMRSHAATLDIIRLDLSLVIAGIPISLPTVMALIIAFGVIALAKRDVVVRRLSSLQELANADLLLTDKTGTLTKNRIVVNEVVVYADHTEQEARDLASSVAAQEPDVEINRALLDGRMNEQTKSAHAVVAYVPADAERKRSTLTFGYNGGTATVSLGAPQVIEALCTLTDDLRRAFRADVERLAQHGYRALALALSDVAEESGMRLVGLFALSDELREDAPSVIRFLKRNSIDVVMVTGDNRAIAAEIAHKLDIPGHRIFTHQELVTTGWDDVTAETFANAQAFAEVLPEDKYELVTRAKRFYTVAANGDGINDLPAIRAASVGFAVKNAVEALRGAADIVLLSDGISVMKDAFIEGRKIFERLHIYSLYRVSESFRLIVTIVILGIAAGVYPLSPLQLILLALLNDIPIISLATDRVRIPRRPAHINVRRQFTQSILYGMVGVANSTLLYVFVVLYMHLPIGMFETLFFLKLTVSGHLLIYVAHTKERWWKYLPSTAVILATSMTQAVATLLALTGFLMPAPVSWQWVAFVWLWSFFFMQVSELMKQHHGHAWAK